MNGPFNIILADCPWEFRRWSGINDVGRARPHGLAQSHYQPMTTADICALPVCDIAADDCALFLWMCWPLLKHAMRVIEAWQFEYKTCAFSWIKHNKTGWGFHMGNGYWSRSNSEVCLLATRGHPKRAARDVGQLVVAQVSGRVRRIATVPELTFAPVREHSRKPTEVHQKIERLMGDVPRIELFARRRYPGWAALGDAVDGRDIRESLALYADSDAETEVQEATA